MKTSLTLLISFVVIVSCYDSLLEKSDPGTGSVESFYNNEEELVLGINGIYNALQGTWWGGAFIHIAPSFDAATDNARTCCPWEYSFPAIANGTMNPSSGGIVAWKWTFGYQAITRINQMLKLIEDGVPGLGPADAAKWQGELRFLRGFIYTDLITVYGDVPLIVSVLTPEEANQVGRNSKSEVYGALKTDFQFAVDNLDNTPNNGEFGRPTALAALAFLGKIQLYQGDYTEAAANLKKIIDQEDPTVVALDVDYESIFNGTNEQSTEILFSLQALGGSVGEGSFLQAHYGVPNLPGALSEAGGWNSIGYSRTLLDDYYMTDGLPIDQSPLYDANDPYTNRDPRFRLSFFVEGDTYVGVVLGPPNFFINGGAPDPVYGAAIVTKKWSNVDTESSFGGEGEADFVLMRYGDVLLMYAEALNETTGPDGEVYSAVNKIRARAGMPDFPAGLSQDAMRDEIRHERRIEFVMEGTRYFDLIRWRTAETVIPSIQELENRAFDASKNYLWPVPQSAIDSNPELITQNPGY